MNSYQEFAMAWCTLGLRRRALTSPLPELDTECSDELEHYADLLNTYKDPEHIHCVFFKLGQPPDVLNKCRYLETMLKLKMEIEDG